jgi:ABC1 atypical kinase-like domain
MRGVPSAIRVRSMCASRWRSSASSIKIEQILSTRGDLLAPEYQVEFAKLQDAAPLEPAATIRSVLVAELGRPVEGIFAEFDLVPVAAASIGQAHAAVLPDGTEVIVKIRRPGVVDQVELDLQILDRTVRVRLCCVESELAVQDGAALRFRSDHSASSVNPAAMRRWDRASPPSS